MIPPPTCGHGNATADADQTVEPMDFTMAVIVSAWNTLKLIIFLKAMSVIATLVVLLLILLFRPKLRRMEVERGILLNQCGEKKGILSKYFFIIFFKT